MALALLQTNASKIIVVLFSQTRVYLIKRVSTHNIFLLCKAHWELGIISNVKHSKITIQAITIRETNFSINVIKQVTVLQDCAVQMLLIYLQI